MMAMHAATRGVTFGVMSLSSMPVFTVQGSQQGIRARHRQGFAVGASGAIAQDHGVAATDWGTSDVPRTPSVVRWKL
jgi:hypothetical protein